MASPSGVIIPATAPALSAPGTATGVSWPLEIDEAAARPESARRPAPIRSMSVSPPKRPPTPKIPLGGCQTARAAEIYGACAPTFDPVPPLPPSRMSGR